MSDPTGDQTAVEHPPRGRADRFLSRVIPLWCVLVLLLFVWRAVDRTREAAARVSCNLGSVGIGFRYYQEEHGRLPPAALTDRYGRPLLSWRVLILPYIEERELYEAFHLDEPWDSPHNIKLLPRMPNLYAPPGHKARMVPPHHTTLHVFVGKGTPFEEGQALHLERDFPDGLFDTFLFVEAGEPVPWTSPQELPYGPDQPLPDFHCLFRDGFRAYTADGAYRFIRKETPEQTLRALITRNGNDGPMGD